MAERKKHMFVVDFWEDILRNFQTLEKYKNSNDLDERNFYNQSILNGICFLVIRDGMKISFGPSRFVGYHNNTIRSHKSSKINGPETNKAISFLMGYEPIFNEELDEIYTRFCYDLGLKARARGSFGAGRKFWYRSDAEDHIFIKFENHRLSKSKKKKKVVHFDEQFESWEFKVNDMTKNIISGEIRIPLINNQKVEIRGNLVSELKASFEWYPDNRSYVLAINKHELMTKEQRIIAVRNLRLKLKEIIPDYLKTYD